MTRASEATSPRSPPITRSPHVEDTKGITVHDKQFPFEPPPGPPPGPFDPPGEEGTTCMVRNFVSRWEGLLLSIAENAIVYAPVWLLLGVQENNPVAESNVAPGGSPVAVRSMTAPGFASLAFTTNVSVFPTVRVWLPGRLRTGRFVVMTNTTVDAETVRPLESET